jgi:hypothetical protein
MACFKELFQNLCGSDREHEEPNPKLCNMSVNNYIIIQDFVYVE